MDSSPPIGPIWLPLRICGTVCRVHLWYYNFNGQRWVAVTVGDVRGEEPTLLRIESACLFGHIFRSAKCDCGYQLEEALARITAEGRGLVVYGVDQDARGLGIEKHFQVYALRQQQDLDTDEVYEILGSRVDERSYEPVAAVLRHLGVTHVRLLSNNRSRLAFLRSEGFQVVAEPLEAPLDEHNISTLMLEKEDLDYTWSFRTHGDWLKPLQARVAGAPERRAAALVAGGVVVAECITDDWNVAAKLVEAVGDRWTAGQDIVYLTDFPRVDELAIYGGRAVTQVVVPFAKLPGWLNEAARIMGVHVQDWGRSNRYTTPRPQWHLAATHGLMHLYRRVASMRAVFPPSDAGIKMANSFRVAQTRAGLQTGAIQEDSAGVWVTADGQKTPATPSGDLGMEIPGVPDGNDSVYLARFDSRSET
jgi:GTP cyclohydrolase II